MKKLITFYLFILFFNGLTGINNTVYSQVTEKWVAIYDATTNGDD